MKMNKLEPVEILTHWEEVESFLRPAIIGDADVTLTAIRTHAIGQLKQIWKFSDDSGKTTGYAVTEIYTPDGDTITAQIHFAAADDISFLTNHLDHFEHWAREAGANQIEIIGRKGWEKIMRPLGFIHNYTSLTRHIAKELH